MPRRLVISNCRLYNAAEDAESTSILIEDGVIRQIGEISPAGGWDRLDAGGRIVAPGFIDIHIQGAGGADVLDGSVEALRAISKTCVRFGTTGFLATTVYRPKGGNRHLAVAAEHVGGDLGGASLLGSHLEGPFISPAKRGMVLPDCLHPPSLELLDEIMQDSGGQVKMMTVAPELPGSLQIIQRLVGCGITASFGHSNASYEQTLEGFGAGISHVTHLFNAMASVHHRCPGPIIAIFESRDVTCQVIADGVHIHPSVLRFAFGSLGAERIIIITDGMQAVGLPDGKYIYNGVEYESRQGAARYKDGTLIGTALGLSQMLARFESFAGCGLEVAIKTVTENPAKLLGLQEKKGAIAAGKDADLVLLEADYSVYATMVAGEMVFQR